MGSLRFLGTRTAELTRLQSKKLKTKTKTCHWPVTTRPPWQWHHIWRPSFVCSAMEDKKVVKRWKDDEKVALKYSKVSSVYKLLLRFAGCDECQQALLLSVPFCPYRIFTSSHSGRSSYSSLPDCLGWWKCKPLTWREIRLESISDNRVWGCWGIKSYPLQQKIMISYDFLKRMEFSEIFNCTT